MIELREQTDYPDVGFCCWSCHAELTDSYIAVPDEDGDMLCLCPPCAFLVDG